MITAALLVCQLLIQQPLPTDNEIVWSKWLAAQKQGQAEVVLVDGSRADIITAEYAYEVEWVKNWQQAIGQSLLYGVLSGRKPAVILLLRDKPTEKIYILRCGIACAAAGIKLETCRTL